MSEPDVPRFRFAPSPTGPPHVGGLHTALFNWALARSMRGDFVVRIDDTDAARSSDRLAEEMLQALGWLGLDWDEGPDVGGEVGPYVQSQRRERHLQIAGRLYEQGDAYFGEDEAEDLGPHTGAPLRLRLPAAGEVVVQDALHGPIRFKYEQLKDPIIVRSDNGPLYHLATVVDDHDMAITHVARGEEWIASTPIHQHIYDCLGWLAPVWVHLPLIRDRQGRKLSKRDAEGGYRVQDFQESGYLPEALFNYLLLLGWSPPQGREIVGKADVRRRFRLQDLSSSPAMFDWDRLNWINRRYIQQRSDRELADLVRPFLEDAYSAEALEQRWLEQLIALLRDDIVRLADTISLAEWALSDTFEFSAEAEEALNSETARPVLVRLVAELAHVVLLDDQTALSILQSMQRQFGNDSGLPPRDVYWPVRAALTGRVQGPALHRVMSLLGKGRCLERAAAILRPS